MRVVNPKSEIRNPKQIRNSKAKGSKQGQGQGFWVFWLIRLLNLIRTSDFGFRVSFGMLVSTGKLAEPPRLLAFGFLSLHALASFNSALRGCLGCGTPLVAEPVFASAGGQQERSRGFEGRTSAGGRADPITAGSAPG